MARPRTAWTYGGGLLAAVLSSFGFGCGPQTSLDQAASSNASTPTGSSSSDGDGDDDSESTGEPAPSVLICEPECTPLMLSTWSYEGTDGLRYVTQMQADEDGSLVLGLQFLDGTIGLLRVSAEGEFQWSATAGLVDRAVALEDIALHPSGDILISATDHGPPDPVPPIPGSPIPPPPKPDPPKPDPPNPGPSEPSTGLLARYDVETNTLAWIREIPLGASMNLAVQPRAGTLAVLDDDVIIVSTLDASIDNEVLRLFEYTADGSLTRQDTVLGQPGTGDGYTPLIGASPNGELLVSHQTWDDELLSVGGTTWRMIPPTYIPLGATSFTLPLDELALDSLGRRTELSHSRGTDTITVLLSSYRSSGLLRWETTRPIITSSDARPALAIGPDDDVYVVTRATPRINLGDPPIVLLEATRWSMDGQPRWSAQLPLNIMATDDPVELVVDPDDGLIVATIVLGHVYIERYEQACTCR